MNSRSVKKLFETTNSTNIGVIQEEQQDGMRSQTKKDDLNFTDRATKVFIEDYKRNKMGATADADKLNKLETVLEEKPYEIKTGSHNTLSPKVHYTPLS